MHVLFSTLKILQVIIIHTNTLGADIASAGSRKPSKICWFILYLRAKLKCLTSSWVIGNVIKGRLITKKRLVKYRKNINTTAYKQIKKNT